MAPIILTDKYSCKKGIKNMTQLSKNFSLTELTKTSVTWANNNPNADQIKSLQALVDNVLQPLRDKLGMPITINSGFRSKAVNVAIRGALTSQHSLGEAADIEVMGMSNRDLAEFIIKNFKFDQLILEEHVDGDPRSGWVHVSYRTGRLRNEVLTKPKGKNVYLRGLV